MLVAVAVASPASADPPTITHYVDQTGPGERAGGRITYRMLASETSSLGDPANLEFDLGEEPEILFASAKSTGGLLDVDWCSILEAQA